MDRNMKFDEFKDYMRVKIVEELPELIGNRTLDHMHVNKHNYSYEGLCLSGEEDGYSPIIDLNLLYDHYRNGLSEEALMEAAESILRTPVPEYVRSHEWVDDYNNVRDRLFIRLMNVNRNMELLQDLQCSVVGDIALTYAVYLEDSEGFTCMPVTKHLISGWGIDMEELHRDAVESQGKIMTPSVNVLSKEPGMIGVSTAEHILGASAIFSEGVSAYVEEELHGDYYLLPSSIHEMIAVPTQNFMSADALTKIVRDMNENVVEADCYLSDEIFHWDSETRTLETARDFAARTKQTELSENRTRLLVPVQFCERDADAFDREKIRTFATIPDGVYASGRDLSGGMISTLEAKWPESGKGAVECSFEGTEIKVSFNRGDYEYINTKDLGEALDKVTKSILDPQLMTGDTDASRQVQSKPKECGEELA